MTVRINRELLDEAQRCADEVGDTLTGWARNALRHSRAGRFAGVAVDGKTQIATREGTAVFNLYGVSDCGANELRMAIAEAVAYCRERRRPRFVTTLAEGRDYIVERSEA